MQRLRRHAQGVGQTILDFAGVGGMGPPSGDPVVGAEPKPRGEVFRSGKLPNISTHLAQKGQAGLDAHPLDSGQVDAELLVKLCAHRLLFGLVAFLATHRWRIAFPVFESVHPGCDLLVAVGHEILMKAPGLQ